MPPTPDTRVDELREQLKALGYLDAGVDRFVLRSATGRRSAAAVALRASLRVGVLGAALLGPAAAIGLVARVPGLVSGVRDALVLAAYLAVVFLAALTAASLAACLIAALVAARGRRAGALASIAGWTVALGTLAYLTVWWSNASGGFGWRSPSLSAAALALAVLISLLLGHAVRVAALGATAAGAGAGIELPPIDRASWRVTAAAGALAFAGAATLLVVATSADAARPPATPALTVVSRGVTVRLIAIDGIDPTLVDERQWSPPGARGYRYAVEYESTTDPARAWTTIATGEPPEVHGIHAIAGRRVTGLRGMLSPESSATGRLLQQATDLIRLTQPSVASRNERTAMTFWEVAEAAGLRTAVVNWWATWPATTARGIVVSDRAVLRLEHGGALDAEIAPPAAYAELQHQWPRISKDARTLAERSFAGVADRGAAAILARSATLDAIALGMDEAVAEPARDLDVVYLPGLDIAQHALLGDRGAEGAAPSVLDARLAALRAYPGFLGELIRPSIRRTDREVTMLLTAPGRVGSHASGHLTMFAAAEDSSRIVDATDRAARAIDLVPTVLNLLGVPISRELPGSAVPAFAPAPSRYVATYGRPRVEQGSRGGRPLDRETLDRLRSLGYIK